jgi:hypothetical protein
MKIRYLLGCCGATLLLLQGCATYTVKSDYDPKANFANLKTYAWLQPKKHSDDLRLHDPLLDKRITEAVNATLRRKGYRPIAERGKADFHVCFHTAIKKRIDVWTMNSMYGYPPGWGWNHYSRTRRMYAHSPRMVSYDEGTLIVDVVNAKNGQLIWRGALQARLDDKKRTPEEKEKRITDAVEKIFARFPPDAKK